MSTNFRRFNSRIGVVFVFQKSLIRLLSWRKISHTLSFLAIYTFICLDPYLLTVLPLVLLLLAVFVPSFLARHPAAPVTVSAAEASTDFEYSGSGPPIAPPTTVKPVKELSKDFFRNMRDLQNCMEDFSQLHDQVLTLLLRPTNFSDERLSSAVFLLLFLTAAVMFIAAHLLPWRFIFLLGGWSATCLGHPTVQGSLSATHRDHIVPRERALKARANDWIAHDVILDSAPETREVEIFELQKRSRANEWQPWLFSPSPYDPRSPARIDGQRPAGTRFFEDVRAPEGWEWRGKKWALDLWSREWVEERIITVVEVETEGERWVYDIMYEVDGSEEGKGSANASASGTGSANEARLPSWEDGAGGGGKRGEWRRRRWTRLVKRRKVGVGNEESKTA